MTLGSKPLPEQRLYSVGRQKYHFMNLKGFLDITLGKVEVNRKNRVLVTSYVDGIEEYLTFHQHLSREVEEESRWSAPW